jgi:nucleotide-binding universal stress UspA family protein
MKILVIYDGTLNSKNALRYGIEKIRQRSGVLFILSVFQRELFIDYEGGPEAERLARKEFNIYLNAAREIIGQMGSGLDIHIIEGEGNPEDICLEYASQYNIDLILTPPRYKSIIRKFPCPVSVIPGIILMPLDNTNNYETSMDEVIKEAKTIHSKIILLGIVPIHLYSGSEKEEIKRIRTETQNNLKKVKRALKEQNIEAKDILREGFADEEILKCADEYDVSLVIIPVNKDIPSELNKSAEIILSEGDRIKIPLLNAIH